MMKLRSKRLFRSSSKVGAVARNGGGGGCIGGEIEWELRPGGMLVQKRKSVTDEEIIKVRVSTGSHLHDVSIRATSTFEELKVVLALVTGLEPKAQRVLFRGKEREDGDHLHMVGVKDGEKVLLLEDPAIKDRKLRAMATRSQVMGATPCPTVIKV